MKKSLLVVPALFFFAGTIFSEITFSPSFSLSPAIESRAGFLLYKTDNASYFHTERVQTELRVAENTITVGGRYLYGRSDSSGFAGKLHAGSFDALFLRNGYQIRATVGGFSFPDELALLPKKPRFILYDSDGFFATLGGETDFFLFDQPWKVSADGFFGHGAIESGDLYYFYGKPDEVFAFGGKARLSAPYGFSLHALGGKLTADIETEAHATVGNANAWLTAAFLSKEWLFPLADYFSVTPFAGYVYLSASGKAMLTAATQPYALFPYKYAGGNFSVGAHFLSVGNSFAVKKGGFDFSLDVVYLFCVASNPHGEYAYQFKKTLFFDGSSRSSDLDLPDTAGIHIFAGIAECAYQFKVHAHVCPTVRLTKMLAAAILNESTKDFLHTAFSSYSTVSTPSSSHDDAGFDTELLKKALLSGTSISVKLAF